MPPPKAGAMSTRRGSPHPGVAAETLLRRALPATQVRAAP